MLALVCGIVGAVLFLIGGFGLLFVMNLPASILAWVFGVRGVRAYDRGEVADRRGMAQAGMILGIVGTIVGTLAVIGWALAIALSEEVRDELRRAFEEGQSS